MSHIKQPPLILIDGSSYLYRAFHALPALTNSNGQPTGAIYGVINMIRRLIKDYAPTHIAVVFDAKGKTFRHELYADYKAHRPPMPDELQTQIKPLHDIIKAMGLPLLIIEGVEADDVIGTLAHQATQSKVEALISTGDKDMAQLVNEHISLINTMNDSLLDPEKVKEKFGVPPKLIIDYLALIGDTSDNIPGVPKVGPKTAAKWLNEYGSLDNLVKHADEIKGKIGDNLRSHLDQLPLSKELATIKCNLDLKLSLDELTPQSENNETLAELFKTFEFRSWLSELLSNENSTKQKTECQYEIIFTEEALQSWISKLQKTDHFCVDTETTSLNYMDAEIVGISFAIEPHQAAYIPLMHVYPDAPKQLDRNMVLTQLKPILENPKIKKIGQNLKYDKEIFLNHDINLQGIAFDTMLESYILDSTATRHDLDSLALKYLGHKTIHYEDVAGKGAKQIPFSEVPIEQAGPYAAEDADIALKLHHHLWPKIEENQKVTRVFCDIEMPLVTVLTHIERHGVLIDVQKLKEQSKQLEKRLLELEEQAFKIADVVFNLDSPKQLQEILYQKLKLPIIKKTPKGQPSTAEPILQELALDFPLPKLVLEYRSLSKLKSTYTDKLPNQVNKTTGRVHTSYHQAITATGRLSSSDPNLQNIPIRKEEGRRIRQAFIAPKGYKLLAADYSQIELRIMAHLSQDKGLLDAFAKGLDIHSATAAEIFGIDIHNVTSDQRRKAKAINFGLIYGMSAFGLAKQLQTERATAQAYIDAYFAQYPKVAKYMEKTREFAREHGYVETLLGRRLYIPEINASNMHRRNAAERAAINAPMQGTAADIIKHAMIAIDNWLQATDKNISMIMQVHDELVFEIEEKEITEATHHIEKLMSEAAKLAVPLVVDIGIGDNWDEAH